MTRSSLGLGEPPWIVGHRGAAGEAPENSLDSLLMAVDQGVDMVEFDLQLTADGQLVACHDWTLERMGGVDLTVEESSFDAIERVEISGSFRRSGVERVLATLEEILTLLPSGVPLNVELKRRRSDPETFATRLAEGLGDRDRVLISSFDWDLLEVLRSRHPEMLLAPLGGRRTDPSDLLAAADRLDAWSVHCRHSLVDAGLVDGAGHRPVLAYTVNDRDAARRLFDLGVRGVFSDFPGRLRREMGNGG